MDKFYQQLIYNLKTIFHLQTKFIFLHIVLTLVVIRNNKLYAELLNCF